MSSKFNIFISYRRKGGFDTAKLLYDRLRIDGYSVSFDIDTLENGNFDNELEKRVKRCKDFLIVLSPGIFDFSEANYDAKDDWVRREIACALKADKNIIPLMLDDFVYPRRLPADIKDITRKNAVDLNPKHFEAAYEKLKQTFLRSKPTWKIRYKKKIRIFIASLIFVFLAYLTYLLLTVYQQKNSEIKEAQIATQKADSVRIEREIEFARSVDSLRIAIEVEIMQKAESVLEENKKLKLAVDSLKKSLKEAKTNQAAATKAAAKPAATKPATPARTQTQTQATKKSKR
jgi:regulator of replication initiation timing